MISKENIEHLGLLARLRLTPKEVKQLETQVSSILDFVSQLSRVDTSGTRPTYYMDDELNVGRSDEAVQYPDVEGLRKAFSKREDNLMKSPKIFS